MSYWEPVRDGAGHAKAFRQIWSWLADNSQGKTIAAIGHRVVHGGERYARPVLIDDGIMEFLNTSIPPVPLHLPNSLSAIRAVASDHPGIPQQ